jgi:hypothetical protein
MKTVWTLLTCLAATFLLPTVAAELEAEAAYTRTITERADKIVAKLDLTNAAHATRVRDLVTRQYRDLNAIHSVRDQQLQAAKALADKTAADAAAQAAKEEAKPKLDRLHGEFLSRLSQELSTAQVTEVKDGLTYGVVPLTYRVYLQMYPDLTPDQKQQIMDWLVEAREIAMDGSTSNEKHAVFGKYKGRINNYLSKAGYDAKKGEQNLKKPAPVQSENKPN